MAKPTREPERSPTRDGNRIAKLLARAGVASRREIERMIGEGRVALNGTVIDTPATILPSLNGVTVDGQPVRAAAPARLFLFHKPSGVLTTANDPRGRATIYDALPKDLPRLMPVGRLDLNTEGLLLLTTDGELKRLLELPSTGVERSYRARAYGQVTQEQLEDLIEGIEIEGVRYGSIDANLERRTGANVWIEMTLTEGKNREVRRVLEHLGLRVSRLIRTRYGPFILADMPVGSVGEVRQVDLIQFRSGLKRSGKTEDRIAVATVAPVKRAKPEASEETPKVASPRRGAPPRPMRPGGEKSPSRAGKPARPAAHPRDAARTERPDRAERPAKPGIREPRRQPEVTEDARPTRSARPPERKTGWARPKPKPGPGGKPRGRK